MCILNIKTYKGVFYFNSNMIRVII